MITLGQDAYFFNHTQQQIEKPHEYASHVHDAYELIYIVRGNPTYTIEDKSYNVQNGDIIIARPFAHHCLTLKKGKYERYNILFDAQRLYDTDIVTATEKNDIFHCNFNTTVDNVFQRLQRYQIDFPEDFGKLLYLLLSELFCCLTHINDTAAPVINSTMAQAIAYINDNLFTIENIAQISNALYISETYLFRIFNEHLKISPKKYINEKRLLAAKQRIASGEKPTSVYLACGFNDYTVFYRNYVKMFGISPSQKNEQSDNN